nr:hypothetical protein [Tanacetum cinerariifolium]
MKKSGRDHDGSVIILPPTTAEEHIAVQRESKARTTLLQFIPDDHVDDFHYLDDVRDICNAVKARFGGNAECKKMQKSMLKQEFSEFRIREEKGLHKGYDRMQKILSQLNQLKAKPDLKTLEVDVKGYSTFSSSQSAGPSHSAFVSATSTNKKVSYGDSTNHSSTTTYSAPSNSKTGESNRVIAAKEFGMIAGCDSEDAIKEGAAKLYNLITGANLKAANTACDAGEFALMGVTSEETPFLATRDEGIFYSGCSRSMTEHKDETYLILKNFINLVENQLNKKVKAIRCDNRIEFKNAQMIELCGSKGIKRDYSNSRTSQQNRAAGRKNRTLIEAAKTMLVDFKLPTMFWTEAVRTACYVLNKILVTSPYNKTPCALLTGNLPSVSHFKPFGCHVTILNTSDHLGKFDGKADEGYIVGYSAINKAYRGLGHEWYFDLDYLTNSLGYNHVSANQPAGTQGATTNSAVPTGKVPVPTGSLLVPTGSIPVPAATPMVPSDDVPVHTSSTTDSIFDGEPTTRFLCPSNLVNHNPSLGIFSSSSYDDEFDTTLNNVASSVEKVRCYKCQQRGHFARECRAKGGNDKHIYSSFKIKEIGKKEEYSKALITVDTLVDWTNHDSESNRVIAAKEFGMIAGCDSEDAIKEGAAKLYNLITGANLKAANTACDAGEFALMGVTSEETPFLATRDEGIFYSGCSRSMTGNKE